MAYNILYLGDTALDNAGSYLAGILSYTEVQFEYIPSDVPFRDAQLGNNIHAVVISDYPAVNFSKSQLDLLTDKISDGMGILMIGGWDSFTGINGGYQNTVLQEILPVKMQDSDDRVNSAQPCVIRKRERHDIVNSLPFIACPPCVAGYNRLEAKSGSQTILSIDKYKINDNGSDLSFMRQESDPMLVIGKYGKGRMACYAGDVAPHWAGGLVDWGERRIKLKAPGAELVEVGNWYVNFFSNMIRWTCQES